MSILFCLVWGFGLTISYICLSFICLFIHIYIFCGDCFDFWGNFVCVLLWFVRLLNDHFVCLFCFSIFFCRYHCRVKHFFLLSVFGTNKLHKKKSFSVWLTNRTSVIAQFTHLNWTHVLNSNLLNDGLSLLKSKQ